MCFRRCFVPFDAHKSQNDTAISEQHGNNTPEQYRHGSSSRQLGSMVSTQYTPAQANCSETPAQWDSDEAELAQLVQECTKPEQYREQAQRLAAVPPAEPSLQQWKVHAHTVDNPLLRQRAADCSIAVDRLQELWAELCGLREGPTADGLQQRLERGMRPEDSFRAGDLHLSSPVWRKYVQLAGIDPQEVALELSALEVGIQLDWCDPAAEQKQREPNHRKKVEGVCAQLQRAGYSEEVVNQAVWGARPVSAALPNLLSDPTDYQFARGQVQKNIACGALLPWPFRDTRPFFVLTLAVVRNSGGKPRLIVDGRLLNLRLQRLMFKYETAADAVRLLEHQNWAWTLDVKAGYHHVMLQPEAWTYVGLEFEGEFYVHAALPFGLSVSPERFTRLMRLSMRPLLDQGLNLTGMVDDSLGAAASYQRAQRDLGFQVEFMGLLGWTLNAAKSAQCPTQLVQYLGLQYDLQARRTTLPDEKLTRFADNLARLRANWSVKLYRSVVGQLASAALALPLSPLLVRALAMEAAASGHLAGGSECALHQQLADFFLSDLKDLVGRPWDAKIRPARTLVVDTSETASGAFLVGSDWKAHLPLSEEEVALRSQDVMSSTEAELLGVLRATEECVRTGTVESDGSAALQVLCDNQSAISALTHMRGGPKVFPLVAQIYRLAAQQDLVLSFAWRRRTTEEVVRADSYSKLEDETDWRLSKSVLRSQVAQAAPQLVQAGYFPPDIDMLASSAAHQVPYYVAKFWDGKCVAQDAFVQCWDRWPPGCLPNQHVKPCLFLFPAAADLTAVLMKMNRERPTAWLVCSRYLRDIDARYVAQWPVKARFPLRCREVAHIVKPTAFNPAHKRGEQWRTPLQVLFVSWEQLL